MRFRLSQPFLLSALVVLACCRPEPEAELEGWVGRPLDSEARRKLALILSPKGVGREGSVRSPVDSVHEAQLWRCVDPSIGHYLLLETRLSGYGRESVRVRALGRRGEVLREWEIAGAYKHDVSAVAYGRLPDVDSHGITMSFRPQLVPSRPIRSLQAGFVDGTLELMTIRDAAGNLVPGSIEGSGGLRVGAGFSRAPTFETCLGWLRSGHPAAVLAALGWVSTTGDEGEPGIEPVGDRRQLVRRLRQEKEVREWVARWMQSTNRSVRAAADLARGAFPAEWAAE